MQDSDFKEIYKQNFNKMMFFAYYYLNNWYEAENVAQETFVVLWNNRNKLDKKAEILPYLTVIARNLCVNVLRKRNCMIKYRKTSIHNSDSLYMNALYDYTATSVYMNEINGILDKALMEMPEKIKRTFLQCRIEGLKYEEIAIAEHISVKTVEYRISTALKILRKYFKDYIGCIIVVSIALLLWTKI